MFRTRIIPILLLRNESLVKTKKFNKFTYVGDPCNTVRIFNELEVDELFFMDILASREHRPPNIRILKDIADECFMPLSYGGGIRSIEDAKRIFNIGFEKISLNTYAVKCPGLVSQIADRYGSQSVTVSIDVKKNLFGRPTVRTYSGRHDTHLDPVIWAKEVERLGAGEILVTAINREGTWAGLDLDLVRSVANAVSVPVIAHGGAGTINDIGAAIHQANASAVGIGSMVVFQKKDMGVLVNFPTKASLQGVV